MSRPRSVLGGLLAGLPLVLLAVLMQTGFVAAETVSEEPLLDTPLREDGHVRFLSSTGQELVQVTVEIVEDKDERQKGLMFRRGLPPDAGMLFVYEQERLRSFWMKNTYIPLDMIFVNRTGEIVSVVARTQPLSLRSCRSSAPARYVVEVNAGFCEDHGIVIGGTIRIKKG